MPEQGGAELAAALHDDLAELLGSLRLRVETVPDSSAVLSLYMRERRPLILTFADVPALPPLGVEGALEELEYSPTVVGPCADGSVYLFGLADGLPADQAKPLLEAACGAADQATRSILQALEASGLAAVTLPPWFRIGDSKDLSFAQSLSRLSLLSEEGEDDFLADRLRYWFERHEGH
jgi:glycosyltransferase A (GT-A) superfamily protein (DUF2064 family)